MAALEVFSVTLGPGDFPRRRLARPRTAGIVGQLPRVRGRTGLPRAGATSSVHLPRVPTRFVQKYTVRGSAGRVVDLDAEQPPERPAQAPLEGPGRPPSGSRARVRRAQRPGLSTGAPRALRPRSAAPRAREPLSGALGDQGRAAHVLLHGRPACPWNGASGVFSDRYGPRNASCSVLPNCSARTCVSS